MPLKELQEQWTYADVMQAIAVLDMYSAIDIARNAYDKAESEKHQREMELKSKTKGRK